MGLIAKNSCVPPTFRAQVPTGLGYDVHFVSPLLDPDHNHKVSVSYHKNDSLASSHQYIGRLFIFKNFLCSNIILMKPQYLAINSPLVSVSGWNSWLEQFRFHFRAANFVHVWPAPAQLCTGNGVSFCMCSAVEVAW